MKLVIKDIRGQTDKLLVHNECAYVDVFKTKLASEVQNKKSDSYSFFISARNKGSVEICFMYTFQNSVHIRCAILNEYTANLAVLHCVSWRMVLKLMYPSLRNLA